MTPLRCSLFVLALGALGGCSAPPGDDPGALEQLPPRAAGDLALQFDGSDDYASLGTAGFPFPRLPQTLSFWVALADTERTQTIVTLNKDAVSGLSIGVRAGTIVVSSVYSGARFVAAGSAFEAGKWHHVAYLYDGTDDAPHHSLYIDGALAGSGNELPNNRTPSTAFLGADHDYQRFFRGRLDELRVWSVARTAEQIRAEMAGEAPSQEPPDLLAYYPFDEAWGARIVDASGRGNHGLLGDGVERCQPVRVNSGVAAARR